MGFIELKPPVRAKSTTGVRVSISESWGLVVSLTGSARAVFSADDPLRVLLDPDAAAPRLRIEEHDDGLFRLRDGPGPKGASRALMLRIGRLAQFPGLTFRGLDCTWQRTDDCGRRAMVIDLPRELRQVERVGAKGVSVPTIPSLKRGTG